MTQDQRDEIDRLVNIWITGTQSLNNDAGWEGDSLMARVIEYGGQPPSPTGNDQSDLSMIHAIRFLRPEHVDYQDINKVMRYLLMIPATRDCALAIWAKHLFRGECRWTKRAWADAGRAAEIDMSLSQFRREIVRAYPIITQEMERVRYYSQSIA